MFLRHCVASVYEWTRNISFEIIVVDNASSVDDIDRLKDEFPNVTIIKSRTNLGFAGANNLGVKSSSGDWLLFLNPDTKLIEPALERMLEKAKSISNLGVVGCRLLNGDGSVQTSSIMKFPRILNSLLTLEKFRLRWPKLFGIGPLFSPGLNPARVEAVSGACMLVRRDTFERVGMFDESYFMYSEDVDLCYRATLSGLNNWHFADANVIHYGGKSSVAALQTAAKTMAEIQFCNKHYPTYYGFVFGATQCANAVLRLAVIAALSWFYKGVKDKNKLASARLRWTTILKTVLTMQRAQRVLPNQYTKAEKNLCLPSL